MKFPAFRGVAILLELLHAWAVKNEKWYLRDNQGQSMSKLRESAAEAFVQGFNFSEGHFEITTENFTDTHKLQRRGTLWVSDAAGY